MHEWTTIASTDTSVTRECTCGWLTIGTIPEPAHHTPLAEREANHLAEAAKIADGSIWNEIPDRHGYQLHLQRRLSTGEPNHVIITAVWTGGSQTVLVWPWTAEGLAAAQRWCDAHPTYWHDRSRADRPVEPGSLATFANAR